MNNSKKHEQLECRAVTLPRRETRWNLQGYPKQVSFRLSIHALIPQIQPDKVVRWCQNGDFLRPVFPSSRVQHISDLHSKFARGPHYVWKYGRHPICPICPLRLGEEKKEEERKKIETTGQKYNGLSYYIRQP